MDLQAGETTKTLIRDAFGRKPVVTAQRCQIWRNHSVLQPAIGKLDTANTM